MYATTIKIENPLLKELYAIKPKKESLSAFVRDILARDVKMRKLKEAAEAYVDFLQAHPKETEWMEDWENADLATAPKTTKKRKKT